MQQLILLKYHANKVHIWFGEERSRKKFKSSKAVSIPYGNVVILNWQQSSEVGGTLEMQQKILEEDVGMMRLGKWCSKYQSSKKTKKIDGVD